MGRPKNYHDTICKVCKKPFYRRTHGGKMPKYCSIDCYAKSKSWNGFVTDHKRNLGKYKVSTIEERARYMAKDAVVAGKIIKPKYCQKCGSSDKRIEAHHYKGYEKEHWFDVIFLCSKCHHEAHHV